MTNNVHDLQEAQRRSQSSGDNDDGTDIRRRLRQLEIGMATLIERVRNIEKNMATKSDLLNIRIWVLAGALGSILLALLVIIGFLRFLLPAFSGSTG